jgi:hypothetical protein
MARPTLYNETILQKARDYIDNLPNDEVIHSIEGMAGYVGISRETIYDWESKHLEFSDIARQVREKQAKQLINGSLQGKLNASISKVMLTKHGYREGIDATTNDKDLNIAVVKYGDN